MWQDLVATATEGSVLDDTGLGKASTVGAVLTSHRLLVVSASLQMLVSLSIGPSDPPISSVLWMGPALLFTDAHNQVCLSPKCLQIAVCGITSQVVGAEVLREFIIVLQVKQLSWDSKVVQLCSLAGSVPAVLVAALADRLLLLRGGSISVRALSVLEPLLHGWASLAAMGVLPGELSAEVDSC